MSIDRKRLFWAALAAMAALCGMLSPAAAHAAEGFATANVNMRSGPSTGYPAVAVIPYGTPVEIHGCLADVPWCDVSFYRGRGWVAGRYVQAQYRRARVYVEPRYYDTLGIPTVSFEFGSYWDRYYRDRDFYRDRSYWRDRDYYRRNDGDGFNRGPDRRPRREDFDRDRRSFDRDRRGNDDVIIDRRGRNGDDDQFGRLHRNRGGDGLDRRDSGIDRSGDDQDLRRGRDRQNDGDLSGERQNRRGRDLSPRDDGDNGSRDDRRRMERGGDDAGMNLRANRRRLCDQPGDPSCQ